jgi:hypothetical protein
LAANFCSDTIFIPAFSHPRVDKGCPTPHKRKTKMDLSQ